MAWSTGIELGPDSCVLVSARPRQGTVDVSAAHVLDASVWPSHDITITSTLRKLRRSARLPRNAALIVWGLPDDSPGNDVTGPASVRPIAAAGFRPAAVMSPPQALAALAKTRSPLEPGAAVAWLALNTWGAAIAIVRDGEPLFARTFDWIYRSGLQESRAQLLQRYSLVAHLAPELQRGIATVRSRYGLTVGRAVTCGDLPDLRSLTMPLIEELDLEVETLDSADGLNPVGRAKADGFGELAPALRLAAAAAATAPRSRIPLGAPLRVAAAVAVAAVLLWQAVAFFAPRPPTTGGSTSPPAGSSPLVTRRDPPPTTPSQPRILQAEEPARPPAEAPAPALPPAPSSVAQRPLESPRATTGAAPPVGSPPPIAPVAPLPRAEAPPPAEPPALKDPLPRIDSILIDQSRRLAIVDGRIVGIGDRVGPRVVVRIEMESVVLREPSGRDVRVNLRDRRERPGSAAGGDARLETLSAGTKG